MSAVLAAPGAVLGRLVLGQLGLDATIIATGIPTSADVGTVAAGLSIAPTGAPTSEVLGITITAAAPVTSVVIAAGLSVTEAFGIQTITLSGLPLLGVGVLHTVSDRASYVHVVSDEG